MASGLRNREGERTEQLSPGKPASGEIPDPKKRQMPLKERRYASGAGAAKVKDRQRLQGEKVLFLVTRLLHVRVDEVQSVKGRECRGELEGSAAVGQ